jgi:adenine-specific DNA-methyltransferase
MNYIGSKYSLVNFLHDTIDSVVGSTVACGVFADLFAGTGVVGSAFKRKGYKIISNDIQNYSYVLNRHNIENTPPIEPQKLAYLNSLNGESGFIYNNYCAGSKSGRNYFTDENGRKCDAIRNALNKMLNAKEISDDEYYYYLAGLINSIDKVANTASVYGAYLKHIKSSASKTFELELLPLIEGEKGKVYNKDISELIRNINGDILYLDPPYNARQYCSNYHVLETIARYDNPEISGVTGLRNDSELKSKFCSKRMVASSFDDLIFNAKFKYIFLSYNNEGLMNLETIREIMSKYGKYDLFTQEYRRFRADKEEARNHKANTTLEYLHVLVK